MKEWLYYILEDDGRSLYVDNGVPTSSGVPHPLINTPDGWQDILMIYERDQSLYGVVRGFTLAMGFVRDGAHVLRDIFYNKGAKRKVWILIQKLTLEITNTTYRYIYRYFYKGQFDFSTFNDDNIDKVTINVIEGGITKLLKANRATALEIPLDTDPETIRVKIDGVVFKQKANFINPEFSPGDLPGTLQNYILPISFTSSEGTSGGDVQFSTSTFVDLGTNPSQDFTNRAEWFFYSQSSRVVNIKGSLVVFLSAPRAYNFKIIGKSNTVYYELNPGSVTSYHDLNTLPFDITVTLPAGEKLFFWVSFVFPGESYTTSTIAVSFDYKFKTTYIKALLPKTLFKRLVGKITGSELDAQSSLLDTNFTAITCGDAIRSLAGSKIKTSFDDFFKHIDTVLNAGVGIENGKLKLEAKAHFFDDSSPVDLGDAKDWHTTFATDYMFNTIKIGYPAQTKQPTDDVNGKYAFNNTHTYICPSSSWEVIKELNLVSPYIADPFDIEYVRINLDGKLTTDNTNDNSVIALDLNPTPVTDINGTYYTLKRVVYDNSATPLDFGLPSPATVFNVEISPARLVRMHGSYIRSAMFGLEDKKLTYSTTEKNDLLKTVLGAVVIKENADINISDLDAPLFAPFYLEHGTKVPADLVSIMEADTNRCFRPTWNGNKYKGFTVRAGVAPNTLQEQKYKLLGSPNNDYSKLVF